VQWQNMAVHEYKNANIAKSQNPQNMHFAKTKAHTVVTEI
jgi:hypothetical protein